MKVVADSVKRRITSEQFYNALRHVLGKAWERQLPRMGLAISGGVDSMALLYLWDCFMRENPHVTKSGCKVFLVDHKARPHSTAEAQQVATKVKQLCGLDTEILTLNWGNPNPSALSNFEGAARKLRYQALGRACARHGISRLMLGHHDGDAMETIIRRISGGHYGNSIAGIAYAAQLPECEGEHGIYESGQPKGMGGNWSYERGGVKIVRPLLSFTKEQLIYTCQTNGVFWNEDETNHDPTFTQRNAIRSILESGKLPKALSTASLRQMAERISVERKHIQHLRNRYLSHCLVHSLDVRSGTLQILLPPLEEVFPNNEDVPIITQQYELCCQILRYLVDVVSPKESVTAARLGTAVRTVFGVYFPDLTRGMPSQNATTVGGVSIRSTTAAGEMEKVARRVWDGLQTHGRLSHRDLQQSDRISFEKHTGYPMWQFSRQALKATEERMAFFYPPDTSEATKVAAESIEQIQAWQPLLKVVQPGPGAFALWDGRYWIRLRQRGLLHGLMITAATSERLLEFETAMPRSVLRRSRRKHDVEGLFRAIRAVETQQAIPAVVAPPGVAGLEPGTILALPTFGLVRPDYHRKIICDVRYKHIEVRSLFMRPEQGQSYVLRTPLYAFR